MPRIAFQCVCCESLNLNKQPAVLMPFVAKRAFDWDACDVTPDWGLRDVPAGHALPLCNTLHCSSCGHVFLDMRFDADEMSRLYHDYRGPAYEALREKSEPGYLARNRRLICGDSHLPAVEAFLRSWVPAQPTVLDWGGDTGLNTPFRQQARIHHILDISSKALVDGAEAVTENTLTPLGYDIVVLSNVLEHIPEPGELLSRVVRAMHPMTQLYIEVPFEPLMRAAERDPGAWRQKHHWHEHINFYSEDSLRCLLKEAKLKVNALSKMDIGNSELASIQICVICQRI